MGHLEEVLRQRALAYEAERRQALKQAETERILHERLGAQRERLTKRGLLEDISKLNKSLRDELDRTGWQNAELLTFKKSSRWRSTTLERAAYQFGHSGDVLWSQYICQNGDIVNRKLKRIDLSLQPNHDLQNLKTALEGLIRKLEGVPNNPL